MKTTLGCLTLIALAISVPAQTHTHGSMVGSIRHDSVVVWTRASAAALVSVIYSTAPSTTGAKETTPILVAAARDFTANITVSGLQPNTQYYYVTRIANPSNPTNNTVGPWGKFKTPPDKGAAKLTFLASGDLYEKTQYGILNQMLRHPGHFYLSLGDMPYADTSKTQADFWQRHKTTRNHSSFLGFIQIFPVEGIWDDHEVKNDWDLSTDATLVGYGKQAYLDYFPLPRGTTSIYRTIRWGTTAELFLLDCRAFRGVNTAPSTPTKSMLGTKQKAWLKAGLLASKAKFKIICSSVPLRYGREGSDDWSGYISERQEILDFITKNRIRNVVVLSADSHVVSVHHHREGIREFQCGPLAQILPAQTPADPEVRFRASVRNFAVVTVDPTVTPETLTVEFFDDTDALLYREVVRAQLPARGKVSTDVPTGEYQLQGPHYFHNRGRVSLPRIDPGTYSIHFDPIPGNVYFPTSIDVGIPAGSEVSIAARWREIPGPKTLFVDTFDQPLTGYTVIDQNGATGGPSAWLASGGKLLQASRIGGPAGSTDADRPGTMLVTGNIAWTDYTTAVRMRSHERGRIGVVFRYQDQNNFYRFVLDEQRPVRRLEKRINGVYTTLASQTIPYIPHNDYDVRCVAVGTTLKVIIDDQLIFTVTDSSLSAGKVGLYVWQNRLTKFEDLSVTVGEDFKPPVRKVFTDDFEDLKITGWTIEDHAKNSGASAWIENLGALMQLGNIGDVIASKPIAAPGTVCLATAAVPADVQFTLNMVNYDDDGMGAVFRYRGAANHYRFFWDRGLRKRQLQKVVGGRWSVLWSDTQQFNLGQWYRVRILTVGNRLRLYVAGELLCDVRDSTHSSGTVGMYSWRSAPVLFDRALIQRPHTELPVLVAVTDSKRVTRLHARAPNDAGQVFGLALAFARTPPIPLAWLNAADPRVIELAPDVLFLTTLYPGPFWTGFTGRLDGRGATTAQVSWPNLPSLKGTKIYAAGWTGDISRTPIRNVFPTVEIIFP